MENLNNYVEENEIIDTIIFIEDDAQIKLISEKIEKKEFPLQTEAQLVKSLKSICNAYEVNIEEKDLRYLVQTSGTNMQDLINETRKLIEYAGKNGTITKKEIDLLATKHIEAIIFDLTDNLGKKEIKNAMDVFHNLVQNKEPVQKILITLYNHFKKLYLVKLGADVQTLKLKPNQTFLLRKYKEQGSYFKEEELRNILEELTNLDANSKIGKIDVNLGLECILCSCF